MYNMYITLSVGFHAVLSHIEGTNANKGNIAGKKNIKKRIEMREEKSALGFVKILHMIADRQ